MVTVLDCSSNETTLKQLLQLESPPDYVYDNLWSFSKVCFHFLQRPNRQTEWGMGLLELVFWMMGSHGISVLSGPVSNNLQKSLSLFFFLL